MNRRIGLLLCLFLPSLAFGATLNVDTNGGVRVPSNWLASTLLIGSNTWIEPTNWLQGTVSVWGVRFHASGGGGEVNYNGEAGLTNSTNFGLVYGKTDVTNTLKSLTPGIGITITNRDTNLLISLNEFELFGEWDATVGGVMVDHPISSQPFVANSDRLYIREDFGVWGATAWPSAVPYVVSGLTLRVPFSTTYMNRWNDQRRGFMAMYVTNWPARISYLGYHANSASSGDGLFRFESNSWFDVTFKLAQGPSMTQMTNMEYMVGFTDQIGISSGNLPRDGVLFWTRPTGGSNAWSVLIRQGNSTVSSNSLQMLPSTNNWQRFTIWGSSNTVYFYTNGLPAWTNTGLNLTTNWLHPHIQMRVVVTNTSAAFQSNWVFIDSIHVRQ